MRNAHRLRQILFMGGLLIIALSIAPSLTAQEATTEPPQPSTETPTTEPPTATFTDLPSPTATFTEAPPPTATNTELPSLIPTETATATLTETPSLTLTEMATTETTAEATAEMTETPTFTSSPTATGTSTEPPTVTTTLTPTLTTTALPPEPELGVIILSNFEIGDPDEWRLGAGWSRGYGNGEGVLQLLNSADAATLIWGDLLNVAVSVRVQVQSGGLRLSVRQSVAGSYSAVLDSGGLLRLLRGDQELVSAFVGAAPAGQWRTLRLSAMGNVLRVALDGVEVIAVADASPLPAGTITLAGEGSSTLWIGEYSVFRPQTELQAETFAPMSAAVSSR